MRLSARLIFLAPFAAVLCLAGAARADAPDPVVARVGGAEIHLSDVQEAAQGLPAEYRGMPQEMLFPALLDQLIDRKAVVLQARREGLDKDPAVARQIARAEEDALQTAAFRREVGPLVTEEAVHARYDHDIAGKPGEEEVHARHILLASESEAQAVVAELKKGGDFAAIAKAKSTDKGSADGGDLGWFKRGDMVPEFAEAAFGLKPGQVTDKPIKTRFGWHVIKLEERRTAAPPTYEQAHDQLRNEMIQDGVQKMLAAARGEVKVEKFNADGSAPRATDGAEPPPAPSK